MVCDYPGSVLWTAPPTPAERAYHCHAASFVEGSRVNPKRAAGSNARTRRRVREMTSKRLSRLVILTGLVLGLTACTSPAPPSTRSAGAPSPTSAETVIPTPSPTEPRLDPVPQHCPV